MQSAVFVPPTTTIDFAQVFDLAQSILFINLTPSKDLSQLAITSITAEVQHFSRKPVVQFNIPVAMVPEQSAATMPLPNIHGVPLWGIYTTTLTVKTAGGQTYKVKKEFNLCPPDSSDPYKTSLEGEIKIKVDCAEGTIYVSDFVCRLYRGRLPAAQSYHLVHHFPPESNLKPVTNINSIPYFGPAYNGLNRITGYNLSQFDFEDHISVVFRVDASAEKNVRCAPDFEALWCGFRAMVVDLQKCQGSDMDYQRAFNEAELLLWSVTVGYQQGEDISDDIIRLEELLNVTCKCTGCAGERVGAGIVCQAVTGLTATNTNGNLSVIWNSAGVPVGAKVRIAIRPYCAQEQNLAWTVMWPDQDTNGEIQQVFFPVTPNTFYQVRATTIIDDYQCGHVYTDTGNPADCPQIVAISSKTV